MEIDDNEIGAMQELYRILKPFDPMAQERIASYVRSRLGAEAAREEQATWEVVQQAINKEAAAPKWSPSTPHARNYAIGPL